MVHDSVRIETPCEIINVVPCNPLISKCQIKVCYVSDEPNRNRSVITKEVARKMANSLPGSPIVGYYNEDAKDFEEHNRDIDFVDGEIKIKDTTRPYGFVDLGAKCWFQKFLDDGRNEHEYLMTEGYIWTGQYPETKRIIEKGNNQSMELDEENLKASWAKDNKGDLKFFIINEAIVSKLCILGEDYEPCFEGSNITKVQYSFEDSFKEQLLSMMKELQELLKKGGTQVFTTYAVKVGDSLWTAIDSFVKEREYASIEAVLEDGEHKFAVIKDKEENVYSLDFSVAEDGTIQLAEEVVAMSDYTPAEEPQFSLEEIESYQNESKCDNSSVENEKIEKDFKKQDKKDESDKDEIDNSSEEEGDNSSDKEEDETSEDKEDAEDNSEDKKKKKYNLEEIEEYTELANKYQELETKFNLLVNEKAELEKQLTPLVEFKASIERQQKEDLINSFYMLSDEDKKDVLDNIDSYSLHDIDAELCIKCVRNKVSFAALEDNDESDENPVTYNLGSVQNLGDSTPAWVQAVLNTAKTLN